MDFLGENNMKYDGVWHLALTVVFVTVVGFALTNMILGG